MTKKEFHCENCTWSHTRFDYLYCDRKNTPVRDDFSCRDYDEEESEK